MRIAAAWKMVSRERARFVFISIEEAQQWLGFSDVVSFFMLQGDGRIREEKR